MSDVSVKVLGFAGSLRKGSLNRMLLRAASELLPPGMTIETFDLSPIPLYNGDVEAQGDPAPVAAFKDAIRAADALLIATPEYNYGVPGVLKNALDWVSRVPSQPFAGKPVALQSASMGILGGARAQYHMRQIMVFLDALVLNKPEVFVTMAKSKVDEASGKLTDEPTREIIRQQLAAFATFIGRVGSTAA
jgi:chromate reductase